MFGIDELGLDLGTSTLRMVAKGKGIIYSVPAYVAYDMNTKNVVKCGEEARRLYERVPNGLLVDRPLGEGRIQNYGLVSKMLNDFMRQGIGKRSVFQPNVLLSLPNNMAPGDRQELVDTIVDAGARKVTLVDENVASAIGAGLRIDQPYGRMNVDIGGGRTDVSIFSFGHQRLWNILDIGGNKFDEAIIDYVRKRRNLQIGMRTAEALKIQIGSARMRGVSLDMEAYGKSTISSLPRAVRISSEELIEAMDGPIRELTTALRRVIERTPSALANDILDEGITICGGGAQLFGLAEVISDQLHIKTTLAEEPDLCVAHGLSALIDQPERYENVDLTSDGRNDEDRSE